jgi:branched-chain amino acid transport system substrate-binding protein
MNIVRGGLLALAIGLAAGPAAAQQGQTIRIGMVSTFTGPNSNMSRAIEQGMRLYIGEHPDGLPAGTRVELIIRDDGGPNGDNAKRLAQELIVREKVQILAGFVYSPNAAAVAPLSAEAHVPMIIMNGAASVLTTLSPYVTRSSFTLWQAAYPLGQWAARKYKHAYLLSADYTAGHDAEAAFEKGFVGGGGTIVGRVRTPMSAQDYAPFLERVKSDKPEILFGFVPAGQTATALMKAYSDLRLADAGIRFIGTGDLTPEDELPGMGDTASGMVTAYHYSGAADRPANRAFAAAWHKAYGAQSSPVFTGVAGWDGMDMIYTAIRAQQGKLDPDRTMAIFAGYHTDSSPRGTISIDPQTRDIVQNIYLREVRKVDGQLVNVELETIGTAVKDPWKVFNRK